MKSLFIRHSGDLNVKKITHVTGFVVQGHTHTHTQYIINYSQELHINLGSPCTCYTEL